MITELFEKYGNQKPMDFGDTADFFLEGYNYVLKLFSELNTTRVSKWGGLGSKPSVCDGEKCLDCKIWAKNKNGCADCHLFNRC